MSDGFASVKRALASLRWSEYRACMTVALGKDVEEYLQDQVRAGVCADASELVNDVLRSLREQQRRPFELTPELESRLLDAADQPLTPLTTADFAGIRERIAARLGRRSA